MSQENVERIREEFENFLAGSPDFGAHLLAADVEWDATDAGILDISRIYHGPEGVAEFWREWLDAWDTVQFEYELIGVGDRVLALVDQRMVGRSTGIEVPLGKYAHLYTFSDGQIVHWKLYRNQSDALKAVGLAD
jgi:ketosteroid isomerase-like protein